MSHPDATLARPTGGVNAAQIVASAVAWVAIVILALGTSGCVTTRTWRVQTGACVDPDFLSRDGAHAVAYTTTDSTRHPFRGRARLNGDDWLIFGDDLRQTDSNESSRSFGFTLRKPDVLSVEYEKSNADASAFIVGVLGGAVIAWGIFWTHL